MRLLKCFQKIVFNSCILSLLTISLNRLHLSIKGRQELCILQIWFYTKQEIITSGLWLRRATIAKLEQNHNYLWCVIATAACKRSLDCWKPIRSITNTRVTHIANIHWYPSVIMLSSVNLTQTYTYKLRYIAGSTFNQS